ncbi:hypothetical protein EVAR_58089_1 [Eumeta japonica]|uniref:Uncharacterized protein n=1 Tax=Eumeta variegata TaxID=151549 RepID=A0A4C1YNI9_EUMVA|nr:hypothetical protein EVAR_58089_1 [Eumeta japonica]
MADIANAHTCLALSAPDPSPCGSQTTSESPPLHIIVLLLRIVLSRESVHLPTVTSLPPHPPVIFARFPLKLADAGERLSLKLFDGRSMALSEFRDRRRRPAKWRGLPTRLMYTKINTDKNKVMVFEGCESVTECDICTKGEKSEQVEEFVYLGSSLTNDGKHDRAIDGRMNVGSEAGCGLTCCYV